MVLAGYDIPNIIRYIMPIFCINTFGMETYVTVVPVHVNSIDIVEIKVQCMVENILAWFRDRRFAVVQIES